MRLAVSTLIVNGWTGYSGRCQPRFADEQIVKNRPTDTQALPLFVGKRARWFKIANSDDVRPKHRRRGFETRQSRLTSELFDLLFEPIRIQLYRAHLVSHPSLPNTSSIACPIVAKSSPCQCIGKYTGRASEGRNASKLWSR